MLDIAIVGGGMLRFESVGSLEERGYRFALIERRYLVFPSSEVKTNVTLSWGGRVSMRTKHQS